MGDLKKKITPKGLFEARREGKILAHESSRRKVSARPARQSPFQNRKSQTEKGLQRAKSRAGKTQLLERRKQLRNPKDPLEKLKKLRRQKAEIEEMARKKVSARPLKTEPRTTAMKSVQEVYKQARIEKGLRRAAARVAAKETISRMGEVAGRVGEVGSRVGKIAGEITNKAAAPLMLFDAYEFARKMRARDKEKTRAKKGLTPWI